MSNLLRLVACLLTASAAIFSVMSWAVIPEQKVLASDPQMNDYFSTSVSISGDTAVIGSQGRGQDPAEPDPSTAYVFTRSNGVWTEHQILTASDGTGANYFGQGVSIADDTLVIGSRGSRSAYIFTRSNGVWTEQQKLTASDGWPGDSFGINISISGDTAVISAFNDDDNGSGSGSAYVYVRSNGVWSEQQKLTASDGAEYDNFGWSVSIDGDTAAIGAFRDDDNGKDIG